MNDMRREAELDKMKSIKVKRDQAKQKEKYIKSVLVIKSFNLFLQTKNEILEKKKIEEYNKRQQEIQRRKKEKELQLQKEIQKKVQEHQEKERKLMMTKKRSESRQEENKKYLLDKLGKVNERVN